jgi:hypothetical protein
MPNLVRCLACGCHYNLARARYRVVQERACPRCAAPGWQDATIRPRPLTKLSRSSLEFECPPSAPGSAGRNGRSVTADPVAASV